MTDWDLVYEMAHKEFNKLRAEQRKATIEECAQMVMISYHIAYDDTVRKKFADAIRSLKDKP